MSGVSRMALSGAAAEIREVEAALSSIVAELQGSQTWSGADADRFQREWHELVTSRLHAAASRVDHCSLIELI